MTTEDRHVAELAKESTDALLREYRATLDMRDEVNEHLKKITGDLDQIESAIRIKLEAEGQWQPGAKIGIPGMSVSVTEKPRARYEPSLWPEIVKWAAETGNQHLIQRRLTDKAVLELVDNGKPLPSGLTVEFFNELSFRRS